MKVLVDCEFSGVVRDAFTRKGHYAVSIDLEESMTEGKHIQRDIRYNTILEDDWDLMIAHPPCTFLCNSGVRWLHTDDTRWAKLKEAWEFFNMLKNCDIPKICVENPIPHKYAVKHIGKYDQLIQPYMFGHGETKATCLWLKNLPKLKPTNIVEGRHQRIHLLPPSKDRAKLRSITYKGIGEAMAEQWGS